MNFLRVLAELGFILRAHPLAGAAEVDRSIEIGLSRSDQALFDECLAFLDTRFLELPVSLIETKTSGTHLLVSVAGKDIVESGGTRRETALLTELVIAVGIAVHRESVCGRACLADSARVGWMSEGGVTGGSRPLRHNRKRLQTSSRACPRSPERASYTQADLVPSLKPS